MTRSEPSPVPEPEAITALLRRWREGDAEAESRLFEIVLPDLKRLARYYMSGERAGHSLQPTALLNEAYLRLAGAREVDWQDRRHFFALAARVMRRILIDHGRRGRIRDFPIDELAEVVRSDPGSLELAITMDRLLEELGHEHPDQCLMVELKVFLGLTDEEAAGVLDLPLRTAQRRWVEGRRWMFERLRPAGPPGHTHPG